MAEEEGAALENTILTQSLTIERLYTELEEERRASATAAEEALSMILRLQEEKAAVMMEAWQYKRLAEQKMDHAEESLAILEETMSHKEIEIASLKYQIQAYKQKWLKTTISNPDFREIKILDYPILKTNSGFLGNPSLCGVFKRNRSMPSSCPDQLCSEINAIDQGGCLHPGGQSILRRIDKPTAQLSEDFEESQRQNLPGEQVTERYNCHWEEAEKLDMETKGLLLTRNITRKTRSESIPVPQEIINKVLMHTHGGNKLSTSREGAPVSCHLSALDPDITIASSQTENAELKQWIKRLENEIGTMRQEYSNVCKVQLKLLKDMYDQLITIQSDIKDSMSKKSPQQDDSSSVFLMEAMSTFWL